MENITLIRYIYIYVLLIIIYIYKNTYYIKELLNVDVYDNDDVVELVALPELWDFPKYEEKLYGYC